ncbi:acyl-coenzyme A oxidase 1 [Pyrenophora seminiperda CCB06]|uniref:Acyl-coenzyme A oxidase 1 n=1 Tax=Pyrenophora seminiperda CCB06 TaxID=1302712 RepID=A0A3M7LVK6_9PLEO|nr:acyl-coenzyme A oxidase 1 [Pyrenophora seminiperda CCB06]
MRRRWRSKELFDYGLGTYCTVFNTAASSAVCSSRYIHTFALRLYKRVYGYVVSHIAGVLSVKKASLDRFSRVARREVLDWESPWVYARRLLRTASRSVDGAVGGHGLGGGSGSGSGIVELKAGDHLSKPTVEGDNWVRD